MPKGQPEAAKGKPLPIGADPAGCSVLTGAMKELLNRYPGLPEGGTVRFEQVEEDGDICFSNDAGALVYSETRDITDNVRQTCRYPFYLVYRVKTGRESGKLSAYEFVDSFAKWLCGEPVTVNGEECRPGAYPKLDKGRRITRITRQNTYGSDPKEDGTQDWIAPVTVEYTNEFEL